MPILLPARISVGRCTPELTLANHVSNENIIRIPPNRRNFLSLFFIPRKSDIIAILIVTAAWSEGKLALGKKVLRIVSCLRSVNPSTKFGLTLSIKNCIPTLTTILTKTPANIYNAAILYFIQRFNASTFQRFNVWVIQYI